MTCEKRKYNSRNEALNFIRRGTKRMKKMSGGMRAYFCEYCKYWHLTKAWKDSDFKNQ